MRGTTIGVKKGPWLVLSDWSDAPLLIVSCPVPRQLHRAALITLANLRLPQILLGGESQMHAFLARPATLAARTLFAPMPEIFPGLDRLAQAVRDAGLTPPANMADAVHLRFGPIRAAQVIKFIRNAAVIGEVIEDAGLTDSAHPFAAGHILPKAVQRCFSFAAAAPPEHPDGTPVMPFLLPAGDWDKDLQAPPRAAADRLDFVSLAAFDAAAWAAGPVPGQMPQTNGQAICLPWNLDFPGSIVPSLLDRLVRLAASPGALPEIILLPFNYVGQTGIIRRLIANLANAALQPGQMHRLYLARVRHASALASLRAMAPVAWVDGNGPEHGWTLRRLRAAGLHSLLIDPTQSGGPGTIAADERIELTTQTRYGTLNTAAFIPSLRRLPELMSYMPPKARGRRARTA